MKHLSKFFLVISLIITFALLIVFYNSKKSAEAVVPTLPSGHLFPSVKTWGNQSGGSTSDMASNYDWLTSSNDPIDSYKSVNSNMILDQYFVWNCLSLVADYENGTPPGILGKWYAWNIQNNSDYEDAFYHANKNVTINQTYDQWGDWTTWKFRYLFRNNLPSTTYGSITGLYGDPAFAGTASLSLSTVGDTLDFGQLDRFDQVNLEFSAMPTAGWQYAWEYSTGQGTWTTLPVSSTWSGSKLTINFIPPTTSQWKRSQVNSLPSYYGPNGVYFVRLRTTANNSTTAPVVNKAYGRNFRNASSGSASGTIPGWDPANDPNGDGYAEANVNPNATAKFKYEARIADSWSWGVEDTNLGNTTYQQKAADFTVEAINAANSSTNRYVGAMIDTASGDAFGWNYTFHPGGNILEYPSLTADAQVMSQWRSDWVNFVTRGHTILNNAGYMMGGNVGFGGIDGVNSQFDFHLREGYASFNSNGCDTNCWETSRLPSTTASPYTYWGDQGKIQLFNWMLYLYNNSGEQSHGLNLTQNSTDVTSTGTHWLQTVKPGSWITTSHTDPSSYAEVASVQSDTQLTLKQPWSKSSVNTSAWSYIATVQDKMDGLTSFMVLQNPATDYYESWFTNYYTGPMNPFLNRTPADTKDYGTPTGIVPAGKTAKGTRGAYLFATGTDPTTTSKPYEIFAREYTKALVLNRPLTQSGQFLNSSVMVSLPTTDTWYPMDYFGNISATPVIQVNLTNADGIILMKGSAINRVTLTKSVDKTSASPGQTLTYTISYRVGNQNATNVKIEDNIPNGTTYFSVANGGTFDSINNKVTWNLGNLSPGATGSVSFQVTIQ